MPTFHGQSGAAYATTGPPRPGGQADVYPAQDPHGQRVAVKVARDTSGTSARLIAEADELSRLLTHHAELAQVVVELRDRGVDAQGRAFLVLPWFDLDLDQWLRTQGLAARLRAAAATCELVTRLHRSSLDWRRGVVHRDIKPKNLLVADAGVPKLLLADFGGAKRADGASSVGSGFHTRGYAPPDQALPRKGDPDRSWDVYALAVTVFECIVGRVPHGTFAATYAYTMEGNTLLSLLDQRSRGSFGESQQRQFDDLSRRTVRQLIDLERLQPLTEADLLDLRAALASVGTVVADVEETLRDALAADPARRQSDARPLTRAMEAALRRVQRSPDAAGPAPAPRSAPAPVVPDSVVRNPRRPSPTPKPDTPADRPPAADRVEAAETVVLSRPQPAPSPQRPADPSSRPDAAGTASPPATSSTGPRRPTRRTAEREASAPAPTAAPAPAPAPTPAPAPARAPARAPAPAPTPAPAPARAPAPAPAPATTHARARPKRPPRHRGPRGTDATSPSPVKPGASAPAQADDQQAGPPPLSEDIRVARIQARVTLPFLALWWVLCATIPSLHYHPWTFNLLGVVGVCSLWYLALAAWWPVPRWRTHLSWPARAWVTVVQAAPPLAVAAALSGSPFGLSVLRLSLSLVAVTVLAHLVRHLAPRQALSWGFVLQHLGGGLALLQAEGGLVLMGDFTMSPLEMWELRYALFYPDGIFFWACVVPSLAALGVWGLGRLLAERANSTDG